MRFIFAPDRLPAGAIVLALAAGAAPAQSEWTALTPGGAPPARSEHVSTLDEVRQEVVLFGGRATSGALLGDTWCWTGSAWTLRATSGPPPRRDAALSFHPASGRVVLFGGYDAFGRPLADTWVWDGAGWSRRAVTPSPPPRAAAALAWDPGSGDLVLFGGIDGSGAQFGDTWRWDGSGWARVLTGLAPAPRFGHRMASDRRLGQIVLFGGTAVLPQTWVWSAGTWQLRTPTIDPGPRERHAMCQDPARARVVLHGGTDGVAYALADTWEWDGVTWIPRAVSTTPPARLDATMTYDANSSRCLVFGGFDGLLPRDDSWNYGPLYPASAASFGTGCGAGAGQPRIRAWSGRLPWLGESFGVEVTRLPPTGAVTIHAGLSDSRWGGLALPLALDFVGMTGCFLYASVDGIGSPPNLGGRAELALQVPNDANLRGQDLFLQSLALDPGATAAGVIASDGLAIRIGAR